MCFKKSCLEMKQLLKFMNIIVSYNHYLFMSSLLGSDLVASPHLLAALLP